MPRHQQSADDSSTELADIIAEQIHLLRRLFKARQYRAYPDVPSDMMYMGGRFLGFVGDRPGTTQSDLIAHFRRDKGQVAKIIRGLRERDLVRSEVDETDRRAQKLYLTSEGQRIRVEIQRKNQNVAQQAIDGLSRADQKKLADLLLHIQNNLDHLPDT
tara:strand:- start:1030 stop:1506 length:477 start_codon:yes stop_codon:yes gene_type:complete